MGADQYMDRYLNDLSQHVRFPRNMIWTVKCTSVWCAVDRAMLLEFYSGNMAVSSYDHIPEPPEPYKQVPLNNIHDRMVLLRALDSGQVKAKIKLTECLESG